MTQPIYALTDTWNAGGTTFTGIGMNVTDTASASGSLLFDLQVAGTSQFHVTKSGANHLKRSNYNIASANTAIITASNYSLTGSNADSMFDLAGTWNTTGTPTAIKTNITDTASNAASLLLDLQVGGASQFKVGKGGKLTAQTLTIGLGGQTTVATNTALGFESLNSASLTGAQNTGVGYQALLSNTTGTQNIAVGSLSLVSNTTGVNNSAIGYAAIYFNTTGSSNSAFGTFALYNNSTGGSNSAFGNAAGDVITTGSRNTIIGANSDPSAAAGIDQTVVGEGLTGKGDDTAFIGGTNGAYNEKNVTTWETTSDQRIKKNIVSNNVGLEVISQIDVRNFEYRTAEEITDLPASAAINQSGVQLGVIAQELQAVLPECVTENSTGVLSVNTDQLIWYLINSVKQLSAKVAELEGAS